METPQRTVPNTPENQTLTESLKDADPLRFLFDLGNVETERAKQRTIHDEALAIHKESALANYYAAKAVERSVDDYMGSGGYDASHGDYEKVKSAFMDVSVIGIPDEKDWDLDQLKEGSTTEYVQNGRDKTREFYETLSGKSYYGNQEVGGEQQERLEQMKEELNGMRDMVAKLTAKRQGGLGILGKKSTPEYKAVYETYNDLLVNVGQIENADIIADESIEPEEKRARVTQYIFEEQAKLREATTEKLKGTKVGKFVEWMNKGNVAVRIGKGLLVGVAGGAVAAGIGAMAGVAGVAAIGAGVAGVATAGARFARGFAMADAKAGRGMGEADRLSVLETMYKEDKEHVELGNNPHKPDDYVQRIADYFGRQYEADTKKEQVKRRKSVAWGLGAMAVGGAIGAGVGMLVADVAANQPGFSVRNDPFFGGSAEASGGGDVADLGGQDRTEARLEFQEMREEAAAQAAAEQAAAEEAARQAEILANTPDPNFYIEPGEGGIHFFQSLGLSEAQWYQVQGDLLNQFPQDFYQNNGQAVRISHSGQLSIEAQKYIKSVFGL